MEDILAQFLSEDNTVRKSAEQQIEAARKDPDNLAMHILQILRGSSQTPLRLTAVVLLRKILLTGDTKLWTKVGEAARQTLQEQLLQSLQIESDKKVRSNVCELVAELAAEVMGDDDKGSGGEQVWPALWSLVQGAVTSANYAAQETGFNLIEMLGFQVATQMAPHLPMFQQLFIARMSDGNVPQTVRGAAARAAVSLLMFSQTDQERRSFATVIPPILMNLQAAIAASDDDMSETMAGLLMEVTEDEDVVVAFKPFLPQAVQCFTAVVASAQVHNPTRHHCLKTLVHLARGMPSVIRKMSPKGAFLDAVLPVVFQSACEWGEQDDDWENTWETGDDETDADEEVVDGCNVEPAMSALSELCEALKVNHVRDAFLTQVKIYMSAQTAADWPKRYAVMAAFAQCCEVVECESDQCKVAATMLGSRATSDPHPRVRMGAVNALCNLIHTHKPSFQEYTHEITMPTLIHALADPSRRVRNWACIAISAYCNELDDIDALVSIKPYIDAAMGALVTAMNSAGVGATRADKCVRESAITSIATLGATIGAEAGRFYMGMRDGLLHMLNMPEPAAPTAGGASPEERKLRQEQERALFHVRMVKGKSLECLSVLGASAGKATFEADARACLSGLVGMLQTIEAEKQAKVAAGAAAAAAGGAPVVGMPTGSDNPIQAYVWDAFGRLAKVLGPAELAPVLPAILPPLLVAADAKTTEAVEYDEDEEGEGLGAASCPRAEEGEGEAGEDALYGERHDGTVIKVRTADLDDKTSALGAVGTLFTEVNRAQRRAGGGVMGCQSILFQVAPTVLGICRSTIKEEGVPMEDIRYTALDYIDECFIALATGITAAEVVGAALDIGALGAQATAAAQAEAQAEAARTGKNDAVVEYVVIPETLPPALASSPAHVYVHALTSVLRDMAGALEDEPSPDMRVKLVVVMRQLLNVSCSRAAFRGEPPHHEQPPDSKYLPLLSSLAHEEIVKDLVQASRSAVQRRAVRAGELKVKDAEGEMDGDERGEIEGRNSDDLDFLTNVTEVFGTLLKSHGRPSLVLARVLPAGLPRAADLCAWPSIVGNVIPAYAQWTVPGSHPRDTANVVSLAVDVLEFVGEGGAPAPLLDGMMGFLVQGLGAGQDTLARQAAAYGAGAVSGLVPSIWAAHLNGVVQGLAAIVQEQGGEDGDKGFFDTAVASLLFVLVRTYPHASPLAGTAPGFTPRESLLSRVMSVLPIRDDKVEVKNVSEQLAALLVGRDKDVLGAGAWAGEWSQDSTDRLVSALRQFGTVLDLIEPEDGGAPDGVHTPEAALRRDIAGCLASLQSGAGAVPPAVLAAAVFRLAPEEQSALRSCGAHIAATESTRTQQ